MPANLVGRRSRRPSAAISTADEPSTQSGSAGEASADGPSLKAVYTSRLLAAPGQDSSRLVSLVPACATLRPAAPRIPIIDDRRRRGAGPAHLSVPEPTI
eukprot:930018-Pleurochrysis_carterae.AAC.1